MILISNTILIIKIACYVDNAPNIESIYFMLGGSRMANFEEIAKQSAKMRRENIKFIPEDCKVNPQCLGSLTNEEFVASYKELQELITGIYADVEKAPFDWGYPSVNNTTELWGSAYNRISDLFGALCYSGTLQDGKILVNSVPKSKDYDLNNPIVSFRTVMNKHKKVDMMLDKLNGFGFVVEGYDKKAKSFIVAYPPNPILLEVMNLYSEARQHNFTHYFSYRWVECPTSQEYPPIFNAELDNSCDQLRKIQEWLYKEAEKYGFALQTNGLEKGCLNYKKGSKDFMRVRQGERKPGGNSFKHHDTKVSTKVSFIQAFKYVPEKMRELCDRFPHVFELDNPGECCGDITPDMVTDKPGGWDKRCPFRMHFKLSGVAYLRCALGNFFFDDIDLDDVKAILELFVIENRIKSV